MMDIEFDEITKDELARLFSRLSADQLMEVCTLSRLLARLKNLTAQPLEPPQAT